MILSLSPQFPEPEFPEGECLGDFCKARTRITGPQLPNGCYPSIFVWLVLPCRYIGVRTGQYVSTRDHRFATLLDTRSLPRHPTPGVSQNKCILYLKGNSRHPLKRVLQVSYTRRGGLLCSKKTRPSFGCAQHVKFLRHTAAKKSRESKIK
jgi:hypothetical protein